MEVSVQVPTDVEGVEQAKAVMKQVGVSGEIRNIFRRRNRLTIPVMKPGQNTSIQVNLETGMAVVEEWDTDLWDALMYLHKSPGPHVAKIRGNWVFTRIWTYLVDGVVYLILFISASGIYLWTVPRLKERSGLLSWVQAVSLFFRLYPPLFSKSGIADAPNAFWSPTMRLKNMLSPKLPKGFEVWNRKFHIYIGLYFLLFIWIFSFSGLMLNHSNWEFTRYWQRRKENVTVHQIQPLIEKEDMARAREVMAQLKVSGEIQQIQVLLEERRFKFRVNRPGRMIDIGVNWEGDRAEMKEITTDGWGIVHMLHQFNGVRMEDSKEARDWFATKLWAFSMDALCLGLIVLILSSLYMWYQIEKKRRLGLIVLGAGFLCCEFFVFGLQWMG